MKKISHLILAAIVFSFVSCNNNQESNPETKTLSKAEMEDFIKQNESLLKPDLNNEKGKNQAEVLVKAYQDFITTYPKDTICAEYLFKAADISRGLGRSLHAVDLYVKLVDQYPSSQKAPLALFLQGFLFDNELNDDKKAGELYKLFIEKYPQNKLVKDAEFSLNNLGKSDEELIEEFEKNQKKNKV